MRTYLALARATLLLTLRDRAAVFFSYIFPLIFFFIFTEGMEAEKGGGIVYAVTMVLILGVVGNGLFGAGVRAVQDREMNILRRFKVTPISPAPILAASMVTGWLLFLPAVVVTLALAHWLYGMPVPVRWLSLFGLVSLGVVAFRAVGLIVASVVNSTQENAILTNVLYLPMLLLSGATIPVSVFPEWLQIVAQFLPASYLATGFQGVMLRAESLAENSSAVAALALTTVLATFLAAKLFRWEKEEKIPASGKLWLAVVLFPFVVLGSWEAHSRENVNKAKLLYREQRRSRTLLIRDARIFVGDGRVIDSGAVLVKNGKVAEVFEGRAPDAGILRAEAVEASGKMVLPGLIDLDVHLAAPGGLYDPPGAYHPEKAALRALAAYLYSGVTSVRSAGDPLDLVKKVRERIDRGERLGAALFFCGPIFGAGSDAALEHIGGVPEAYRSMAERQLLRLPRTPQEARRQVAELKEAGVDGIQAVLETGRPDMVNRLDPLILRTVIEEARARRLPVWVRAGTPNDVAEAVAANAGIVEYGTFRDRIPNALLARIASEDVALVPGLSWLEALSDAAAGEARLLERSLVQQVGPKQLVDGTRAALQSSATAQFRERLRGLEAGLELGRENLRRAHGAGVLLAAGTGAGNFLVLHGPAVHRELQLWVRAGIPPGAALQAATYNAARLLRAEDRIGLVRKGYDADLLIVDGNPLEDIAATERISLVIFKGERLIRADLLKQE